MFKKRYRRFWMAWGTPIVVDTRDHSWDGWRSYIVLPRPLPFKSEWFK